MADNADHGRSDGMFLGLDLRNGSRDYGKRLYDIISRVHWKEPVEDMGERIEELRPMYEDPRISKDDRERLSRMTAAAISLNQLMCGAHVRDVFGGDVMSGLPLLFEAYRLVGDAYDGLEKALERRSRKREF